MRDPEEEAGNAHSQGHQLLPPQVGPEFGAKLIFEERYGHFHVGKLNNEQHQNSVGINAKKVDPNRLTVKLNFNHTCIESLKAHTRLIQI